MLTTSARADLLTFNYSGYFGPNSTLGGTAFGADTAFSLTCFCNTDSLVLDASDISTFTVTSLSMVINGTAYTGSPSDGLLFALGDSTGTRGTYGVGIYSSDLSGGFFSNFSTATPAFLAGSPTSTVFSDNIILDNGAFIHIALTDVVGGLILIDESAQPFTASVEVQAVPEPSTFALLGLGALGLAAYRRKRVA